MEVENPELRFDAPKIYIVPDFPPMFDEIDAKFNLGDTRIIFAWGTKIYNPYGIVMTQPLIAHELVHMERQGGDVEGWWRQYIDEKQFRLMEEVVAHQQEYKTLAGGAGTARLRQQMLEYVAKKLAHPIYGPMVTVHQARTMLKKAEV